MKKKFTLIKILITSTVSLYTLCLSAQDSIRISGQLQNNMRFAKVVVKKFAIGVFDIAAITINKETGAFSITAPKDIEPGIYRFQYSQSDLLGYLDIIIDGKENEVEFALDLNSKALSPVFKSSTENKIWYAYNNERNLLLQKIQLIGQFINEYSNVKDAIYNQATKAYNNEIKNYNTSKNLFLANNKATWAAEMVANSPFIFSNPKDDVRIQDYNKKENYWNEINTSNPKLINTPLYTEHILNYLKYYMNPEMEFDEEEQNKGFKKCIDTILQRFGNNEQTKEFAIKYLQMGFKEIGNEDVLQYLDENFAATAQCTGDDEDLKKRLVGYESLKPGNPAPQITVMGNDGKEKSLFDFEQQKIVLVFWASWCPHCMQEMPKLQTWAKEHPETLILSISLDDDYTAFQNAIKDFPDMMHYCDLQKWNGDIVKNYFVAATPTVFELDKERKIVAKWNNINNLLR